MFVHVSFLKYYVTVETVFVSRGNLSFRVRTVEVVGSQILL